MIALSSGPGTPVGTQLVATNQHHVPPFQVNVLWARTGLVSASKNTLAIDERVEISHAVSKKGGRDDLHRAGPGSYV